MTENKMHWEGSFQKAVRSLAEDLFYIQVKRSLELWKIKNRDFLEGLTKGG